VAVLAEYDLNMDHPCVRTYTKAEVDANRKFLAASGESLMMREFLKKLPTEKIQSGEVKVQVIGKHAGSPESVLELLKQRMLTVEKERDELKPQWLRDWQDSRGRGQSAPL